MNEEAVRDLVSFLEEKHPQVFAEWTLSYIFKDTTSPESGGKSQ